MANMTQSRLGSGLGIRVKFPRNLSDVVCLLGSGVHRRPLYALWACQWPNGQDLICKENHIFKKSGNGV